MTEEQVLDINSKYENFLGLLGLAKEDMNPIQYWMMKSAFMAGFSESILMHIYLEELPEHEKKEGWAKMSKMADRVTDELPKSEAEAFEMMANLKKHN